METGKRRDDVFLAILKKEDERMNAQGMNEQEFEDRFQALLLLAGEPEATSEFNARLQAVLNETAQDLDMAMTQEEFETVRLHLPLLRQILETQERFCLDLRQKALAECWPDSPPAGEEATN
jgi:hypothetical protein